MCSNNIWAGTKVKATTKNYSAEAIDVQPTGKIDFSNSGDVVVHASSEFGATAVVAYGAVTFNNSGNVLLKSEITGNQTAQRNVVGVMSQDSSFTVTDKVQELRIDLKGAGVDFNPANPGFSDGTQAIAAQENAKIDIKSKNLVINIDVPSTLTDKSPSGTTSKQAFGINARIRVLNDILIEKTHFLPEINQQLFQLASQGSTQWTANTAQCLFENWLSELFG